MYTTNDVLNSSYRLWQRKKLWMGIYGPRQSFYDYGKSSKVWPSPSWYRDTVLISLTVPLTGKDDQCHLLGTQAIISICGSVSSMTELQKSIAWVGLRQEIRIAFISQRAVNFPLHVFSGNSTGEDRHDGDWANRMVLHVAQALNCCFGNKVLSLKVHEELVAHGQLLIQQQPNSVTPLFFSKRGNEYNDRFPQIMYLNDAIGM